MAEVQCVKLHPQMFKLPELSIITASPPPFLPAWHDLKAISVRVSDPEEETLKHNAPPRPPHMQELNVRLERTDDVQSRMHITPPSPWMLVIEVKLTFNNETEVDKERSSLEEERRE